MTKRRRAQRDALALLLASLVWWASPCAAADSAPASSVVVAHSSPGFDSRATLPPGFRSAVSPATISRFLQVVTRDIDRDGDLDVIATDGTADLLVWENDGAGHFTRKTPDRRSDFDLAPREATVHGDPVAGNDAYQNDGCRPLHVERDDSVIRVSPGRRVQSPVPVAVGAADLTLPTPRAPPLTCTL